MPDLSALPAGTRVFVDTNIFHFHFQARSVSCSQFITRIALGEIEAYVNTQVLSDLLHKLMLFEAFSKNRIRNNNDVRELKNFLKTNRGKAMPLTDYETQFENILAIGLRVLPITEKLLVDTKSERQSYCLMTGDSLHLGTMNRCRAKRRKAPLQDIVTYDNDFAFIPGVTVWQPTDVIW
jgi:predicted nucleic acid-binding protein